MIGTNKTVSILLLISAITAIVGIHPASAQEKELDPMLVVTDQEKIILFSSFAIAIIAIVLFMARDVILGKKTSYDQKEKLESKKDKTFEKYHSDWGDDYEELGQRRNSKADKEFRNAAKDDKLLDHYATLGLKADATAAEIKSQFRNLAKKTHPDKTKQDSESEMAKINKAYEVLSDKENKERYDRYFKTG